MKNSNLKIALTIAVSFLIIAAVGTLIGCNKSNSINQSTNYTVEMLDELYPVAYTMNIKTYENNKELLSGENAIANYEALEFQE